MLDLNTLRKKYPRFVYESFSYSKNKNNLVIEFKFKASELEFNPQIEIENVQTSKLQNSVLDNFAFHLGLIEMISYWKATCSPNIQVSAGQLSKEQAQWWENLILKGLGEFFLKNKINFKGEDFLNIKSKNHTYETRSDLKSGVAMSRSDLVDKGLPIQDRYLVLNSGGRDSVVSIETLKNLNKEIGLFMLNPTEAALKVADHSGVVNKIIVKRGIDEALLELNKKGYLNGHTPFSAYLAFLSLLCAFVFDYRYVVVSNERSSNEENTEYLGEKINHQYSKSFEFEKSFREYSKQYLSENIEYFSLLRPLYELQISKLFSTHQNYYDLFKSCNVGQKQNAWCGKCTKCLSIFVSLYPFLGDEQIRRIFKKSLYEDGSLKGVLLHITGKIAPKPFECVGTYEEVLEGLRMSIKKLEEEKKPFPSLLQYARENILIGNQAKTELLKAWDENNFLTEEMTQCLKTQI